MTPTHWCVTLSNYDVYAMSEPIILKPTDRQLLGVVPQERIDWQPMWLSYSFLQKRYTWFLYRLPTQHFFSFTWFQMSEMIDLLKYDVYSICWSLFRSYVFIFDPLCRQILKHVLKWCRITNGICMVCCGCGFVVVVVIFSVTTKSLI